MDTFSEVFKAIASYPWQVNVGVLSLIPLYIIDFKFFCKLNIGLQRKIALAKEAWTCGARHDCEGGCEEARCQ